jgi:hypothetical protein
MVASWVRDVFQGFPLSSGKLYHGGTRVETILVLKFTDSPPPPLALPKRKRDWFLNTGIVKKQVTGLWGSIVFFEGDLKEEPKNLSW